MEPSIIAELPVGLCCLVCPACPPCACPLAASYNHNAYTDHIHHAHIDSTLPSLRCGMRVHPDSTTPLTGLCATTATQVSFPALTALNLECAPLKALHFTTDNTPALTSLHVSNQGPKAAAYIKLALPGLLSLWLEYVELRDSAGLGPSLTACPALRTLNTYKLWGLGEL